MSKYIVFAGVNGSGKSTLYQTQRNIAQMPRVNTDEIVREFGNWKDLNDVMNAGKIAVTRMNEYLEAGITFNQETTLCGNGIINAIKKAKRLGYVIELHFVSVDSVEIAKERIAFRVEQGGHGIPDQDVKRRYYKSFENLKKILPICDLVSIYDNTNSIRRIAIFKKGRLVRESRSIPEWYNHYVKGYSI